MNRCIGFLASPTSTPMGSGPAQLSPWSKGPALPFYLGYMRMRSPFSFLEYRATPFSLHGIQGQSKNWTAQAVSLPGIQGQPMRHLYLNYKASQCCTCISTWNTRQAHAVSLPGIQEQPVQYLYPEYKSSQCSVSTWNTRAASAVSLPGIQGQPNISTGSIEPPNFSTFSSFLSL
jgi:hypothetical protein